MERAEETHCNRARAARLIATANELLALARELERVGQPEASLVTLPRFGKGRTGGQGGQDHPVWVELARQCYDDRRRRARIFASDELFGEPAWDILLDLFVAAKERRRVSVTSACIGAAVPSTTALRWIGILERRGLLLRRADPGDARRIHVELSATGYGAMVEYFSAASRALVIRDAAERPGTATLVRPERRVPHEPPAGARLDAALDDAPDDGLDETLEPASIMAGERRRRPPAAS